MSGSHRLHPGGRRAPGAIVVFGSSGNLATTKLLPAIEGVMKAGRLSDHIRVVGVDRRPPQSGNPPWLTLVIGDLTRPETYARLAGAAAGEDVLFYLATAPRLFPQVVEGLERAGLAHPGCRIVVEKPFGVDLRSSRLLESRLRSTFTQRKIFRVDHFLCKDGVIGMAHFRFAYGRLEHLWNSRFVDSVQIMADEDSVVTGRGDFYDSVGVVRDMVQNHLLQLFCLVAMDRPGSGDAGSRGSAKAELLKSVVPISPDEVVWGQYRGYGKVAGVRRMSRTPTFVALKLLVKNRRWHGVPFYLRSGRPLARDSTEVVVIFKKARGPKESRSPRLVRFCIDPVARTTVTWGRSEQVWKDQRMARENEGEYHRVITGALRGDQGRFVDSRFNELSWGLFDPVIKSQGKLERYDPGGWGPGSADLLLTKDGRTWLDGRDQRFGCR